ncbi:Transcriptional regulatory protein YpdB [Fundidesulfovibrio magnetotacticus]|uniref:Transcriptional regulatory protein YpdB n=1 Tax=Fundidesulfovibrio magnetotacticus TaxID=2730080 RepID=A0A6V8LTR9_9BACT|nr:LytTR family DNA-binding domain-containing protein [Fundidesulfovibrio magnetotacticus]GFK93037.1 Transcriptional regulatory protein YpdB [Fundidesulfovibrio magnetotacticus]
MPQVKTLIVHSDPAVRAGLRQLLAGAQALRVLGEAATAFEALEMLEAIPYGVFFVSPDLPGPTSGMELAQMLAGRRERPALVFVAADESQACKAFELGAADYLVWPALPQRLDMTLARLGALSPGFKQVQPAGAWVEERSARAQDDQQTLSLPIEEEEEGQFISALKQAWDLTQKKRPVDIEKLPITLDGRTLLLPYPQILFVEAYEDYSFVHTVQQKYLTSYRLKNLEERLGPHGFFRVHRKFLVNLEAVTEIASLPGGQFMLRTQGKTRIELPISRRRIGELKQVLGL